MHAYERQAYRDGLWEMPAYRKCTPVRGRLWDGLWERHAYERHAYGMTYVRGSPMRWPIRDARL